MKKIIAIDCGKMYMKARYNDKLVIYENKYDEKHNISNGKNNWNVVYENKDYFIGQYGDDSDWLEGKSSKFHIISTLTCITRFLNTEEVNDDIVIVYGESVDLYFNRENKEKIINELEGNHVITIEENGKGIEYKFTIKKVHVLPEGYGHILSNLSKYMGVQYVIDIGGKTINFLKLVNGMVVQQESFSEGIGIIYISSQIETNLKRKGVVTVSTETVYNYLVYGVKSLEIQKVIHETIMEHLRYLEASLAKRNIYINKLIKDKNLMFIGGGSVLFKKEILSYYGDEVNIIDNCFTSNVEGYYSFGMMKYI